MCHAKSQTMSFPTSKLGTDALHQMLEGESGYMVPWGMFVRYDGKAFVNENYTITKTPRGTSSLKITKVKYGYKAHIHAMKDDYTWQPQAGPSWMGKSPLGLIVAYDEPGAKPDHTPTRLDIRPRSMSRTAPVTKSYWESAWEMVVNFFKDK